MNAKKTTLLLAGALVLGSFIPVAGLGAGIPFTDTFHLEDCRLGPRGVNDYFIPRNCSGSLPRREAA